MQIRATSDFSLDAETVAHEGDVLEVQDRLGIELVSANKAVKVEPEPAPAAEQEAPPETPTNAAPAEEAPK